MIRRHCIRAAACVAVLSVVAACGGSEPDGAPNAVGGGGADRGGAATSGGEGGGGVSGGGATTVGGSRSGGAANVSGAAGQPSGGLGYGQLVLAHQLGSPGVVEFRPSFGYGATPECPVVAKHAECSMLLCEPNDPATASTLSAGNVRATSAPVALQLLAEPDAQEAYGYPFLQQKLMGDFRGGETVTLAAAGGEVPPFSQDLTMFAPVVLTKPDSTQSAIPIPYSGVTLEWSGGEVGSSVTVVAFGGGEGFTLLRCTWDASAGAGWLPPEALKLLPKGKELAINVRRDATVNVGDFEVTLSLVSGVRNPRDTGGRLLVLDDSL